jgi:hypothetical protein
MRFKAPIMSLGGDMQVMITVFVSESLVGRVCELLSREALRYTVHPAGVQASDAPDAASRFALQPPPDVQEMKLLLDGRTLQLVKYFVQHNGQCFNDEIARELDFDNPAHTSSILGKVSGKLKRVGQDHHSWYSKTRKQGRTFLRVRADVLEFFKRVTG